MKDIRIQPSQNGSILLVDVVCDCGHNDLADEATGETSFKHAIKLGSAKDKILICDCGKRYRLHPQANHIHIFSEKDK